MNFPIVAYALMSGLIACTLWNTCFWSQILLAVGVEQNEQKKLFPMIVEFNVTSLKTTNLRLKEFHVRNMSSFSIENAGFDSSIPCPLPYESGILGDTMAENTSRLLFHFSSIKSKMLHFRALPIHKIYNRLTLSKAIQHICFMREQAKFLYHFTRS